MTNFGPLIFNFHDLVAVVIYADDAEARDFFAAEYAHHLTMQLPERIPSVILRFRHGWNLTRLTQDFVFHQHKWLARWRYQIHLSESRIELDVIGNRISIPMVHHMLIHPSLRYLSALQGVLLLHASAVACNGRSFIFTGSGGTGKTTIASLALAGGGRGWGVHADDYVFLGPERSSMAYLTRAHIYRSLLHWVPEVRERLTTSELLQVELFGRVRQWSRGRIKWPVRLPVERLWPDQVLVMQATSCALIMLERSQTIKKPQIRRLSPHEFPIDALISMNFNEAVHFLTLVEKSHSRSNLQLWIDAWKSREREILSHVLNKVSAYQLELPAKVTRVTEYRTALIETLAGLSEQTSD